MLLPQGSFPWACKLNQLSFYTHLYYNMLFSQWIYHNGNYSVLGWWVVNAYILIISLLALWGYTSCLFCLVLSICLIPNIYLKTLVETKEWMGGWWSQIGMLVIYCCITNDYKLSSLQSHTYIISWFLWVRNPGKSSAKSLSRGCNQGVGQGWHFTQMPSWGRIHFQAHGSVCRIQSLWSVCRIRFLVGCWAQFLTGCQAKPALSSVPWGPLHRAVHGCQLASETKESLLVRPLQSQVTESWKWHSIVFAAFCLLEPSHRPCLHLRRLVKGVNTRRQDHWGPS